MVWAASARIRQHPLDLNVKLADIAIRGDCSRWTRHTRRWRCSAYARGASRRGGTDGTDATRAPPVKR